MTRTSFRSSLRVAIGAIMVVVWLLVPEAMAGTTLEGGIVSPYRDFTQASAAELMLSQLQAFSQGVLPQLKTREALLAEAAALLDLIHRYDLQAAPHVTDGWSNFIQAEWPLMNIVYTGLALCNLAEIYPDYRETAAREVRFLLGILKMPAVSGFMTPHFGEPFPRDRDPGNVSVFLHGHYLYLAMRYRMACGAGNEDPWIAKTARALARDFRASKILRSYGNMYFLSDNASALAALALYDKVFGKSLSPEPVKIFVDELYRHYLDPANGLLATYINPGSKTIESGARGISVMYSLLFLADADPGLAKNQWDLARKTLISPLSEVIERNRSQIPIAALLAPLVKPYLVCLEFPGGAAPAAGPEGGGPQHSPGGVPWEGDTDSGPVVLGVGTSATGFAIGAAYTMGEPEVAERIENLALIFGDPTWKDGKLYYRNMFHPVGQAVVLYGKTIGLRKKLQIAR